MCTTGWVQHWGLPGGGRGRADWQELEGTGRRSGEMMTCEAAARCGTENPEGTEGPRTAGGAMLMAVKAR